MSECEHIVRSSIRSRIYTHINQPISSYHDDSSVVHTHTHSVHIIRQHGSAVYVGIAGCTQVTYIEH